ncbi:MAG: hypothetical protein WCI05_11665 [Myxococcales bacterium]
MADEVEAELEDLGLTGEGELFAQEVELGDAPGVLVAVEEQGDEGHEVRFSTAEAPLEEGGAASSIAQGGVNEPEGALEGGDDAWGDDVILGGDFRLPDGAGELLDEPDLVDRLGEVKEVFDAGNGHWGSSCSAVRSEEHAESTGKASS